MPIPKPESDPAAWRQHEKQADENRTRRRRQQRRRRQRWRQHASLMNAEPADRTQATMAQLL